MLYKIVVRYLEKNCEKAHFSASKTLDYISSTSLEMSSFTGIFSSFLTISTEQLHRRVALFETIVLAEHLLMAAFVQKYISSRFLR